MVARVCIYTRTCMHPGMVRTTVYQVQVHMYNLHRCTSSSIQYDRMYSYSTSTSSRSFACLTLSLAQTIISRQLSRCVRFIRFSIRNSRCFAMGALALSDSSGKELIGGTEPEQKALDNVRAEYDEKMRLEREERERRRAEAEQAAQLRREQEALRVKETPEQRVERVLAERDAKEKMAREQLERHIQTVDKRMEDRKMLAAAAERRRQMEAFAMARKEPPRRKMYDDKELTLKAQLPGPGAYNASVTCVNRSTGKTFSPRPYDPRTSYDKYAGTQDDLQQRRAAQEPSAVTYSPNRECIGSGSPRIRCHGGVSLGLTPKLMETYPRDKVPAAHDIAWMVRHLSDLPAPDAYEVNDVRRSLGFRMMRPKSSSVTSPRASSDKTPGPGTYELPALGVSSQQATGRQASITGLGFNCTELDRAVTLAKTRPGPGQYESVRPPLRGTPRFVPDKREQSFIAQVMAQAGHGPGPGTYALTPTVNKELQAARRLAWLASTSTRSPRAPSPPSRKAAPPIRPSSVR